MNNVNNEIPKEKKVRFFDPRVFVDGYDQYDTDEDGFMRNGFNLNGLNRKGESLFDTKSDREKIDLLKKHKEEHENMVQRGDRSVEYHWPLTM